jgi:pimeloyl-ACP methyl ester carboxylesterase
MSENVRTHGRTYVLVHGAWFGGWVWKPVATRLTSIGHHVYAPSLTGLGERRHLLRPGITLDTHADDIVNLVEMEDLHDIVLVGWSYGGMVVTDVLGRIPDRVGSVVYLDAMLPDRGRSQASYTGVHRVESLVDLATRGLDIPPMPAKTLGVSDEALMRHIDARLCPQPVLTFLSASNAPDRKLDIPYTYVLAGAFARQSNTFSHFYDVFLERHWGSALVVETGHVMMLTAVDEMTKILNSAD